MKNEFVESLKRLFSSGNVAIFKLEELKKKGKISEKEFEYITQDKEGR